MGFDSDSLARSHALLGVDDRLAGIREIPADPASDDVGAEGAYAYEWGERGVVANVYQFDGYARAQEAANRIRSGAAGRESVVVVNGPLLMYAKSQPDDAAGRDFLLDLNDSFAGEE